MFIMGRATFVMSKGDAASIDGRFVCDGDGGSGLTGDDRDQIVRLSAEFHSKDISFARSLGSRVPTKRNTRKRNWRSVRRRSRGGITQQEC